MWGGLLLPFCGTLSCQREHEIEIESIQEEDTEKGGRCAAEPQKASLCPPSISYLGGN
nr:MAG TPA: hypothetical protein [Bacteriophage sp.]